MIHPARHLYCQKLQQKCFALSVCANTKWCLPCLPVQAQKSVLPCLLQVQRSVLPCLPVQVQKVFCHVSCKCKEVFCLVYLCKGKKCFALSTCASAKSVLPCIPVQGQKVFCLVYLCKCKKCFALSTYASTQRCFAMSTWHPYTCLHLQLILQWLFM